MPILVANPESAPYDERVSARSSRELLVDDNQDALDAVGTLLKLHEHHVRAASSAAAALTIASDFLPEVALIDIGMPGTDGFQLARQLRAQVQFEETILVALTGFTA